MGLGQPEFKIYTYSTDIKNSVFKQLTTQLDVEVLPILTEWRWDFYPKSLSLYETLKNVDGETIVLVCDAYDVLPINGITNDILLQKIISEFDLDKITFNAEKNCYPNTSLEKYYPNVGSIWKYLNAGLYVGKVKNIIRMVESALPKMMGVIDQEIFSIMYLNNDLNIEIDYTCKVFQTLYMIEDNDLTIDNDKIINNKTGGTPLLLHGNGKSPLNKFLTYDE
jgi:hypothetical protein